MKATATLRYLRISPRKVRMVSDLVRGKKVEEAQTILRFAVKRGTAPILKLLHSAVASAKHNFQGVEQNLYISRIVVNEGPTLKRVMHMSRGQAYPLQKRSSHITIEVNEINPTVRAPKTQEAPKQEERVSATREKNKMPKVIPSSSAQGSRAVRPLGRIFRRKAI